MPVKDYVKSVRQADLVIAFGPIADKVNLLIETEALACKFYRLPTPALLDRDTGDSQQRLLAGEVFNQIASELKSTPRDNIVLTAQVKDEVVRVSGGQANNQLNLSELQLLKDAMQVLGVTKIDITFAKETDTNGKTQEDN